MVGSEDSGSPHRYGDTENFRFKFTHTKWRGAIIVWLQALSLRSSFVAGAIEDPFGTGSKARFIEVHQVVPAAIAAW